MAAVNKVEANGKTLIDLTADTVTADTLGAGATAHDAAGNVVTGTAVFGGGITEPVSAGDTPVMLCYGTATTTSHKDSGMGFVIPYRGTYRIKFAMYNTSTRVSSQAAEIYKNGVSVAGFDRNAITRIYLASADIDCEYGDIIKIYTLGTVGCLTANIAQSNGF